MKTGLVLEGGALRTIFSSGACDALLDGGVMTDYVIGVSAGIAYGVSYISRQKGRNLEILTKYANDPRYMGARNLLDPRNRCYFGLDFTYNVIPNKLVPFDYETFAAFPGEVEAVVTNLNTGRAEYLSVPKRDQNFILLRATCAMPLLFPVFRLNGMPCLDGGAADAIPFERAFSKECDRVIVILTRERDYLREPEKLQPLIDARYRAYPKFCETMRRRAETYNECRRELFSLEREGRVLLIAPGDTLGFSRTERDVGKIRKLYGAGYYVTKSRMDEIKRFLTA